MIEKKIKNQNLNSKVEIIIYYGDKEVLNETKAKLLFLISRTGSILSASKILNLSYSRAWEYIIKIENILGMKVIEAKRGGRGGGGTRLTENGYKLLNRYLRSYKKVFKTDFSVSLPELSKYEGSCIYAGSDDALIKKLIGFLREDRLRIESYYIGSMGGISSLILEESDFTGIHLYDPIDDEYNVSFIRKYAQAYPLLFIKGYYRLQGFVARRKISREEILDMLFQGKLKFINRNIGSGTRVLIDHVLEKYRREKGFKEDLESLIEGYNKIVYTHFDVASAIAEGSADIGICIESSARYFNLNFIPLKWERFDFIVRDDEGGRRLTSRLSSLLRSDRFKESIDKYPGYRYDDEIGRVIRFG